MAHDLHPGVRRGDGGGSGRRGSGGQWVVIPADAPRRKYPWGAGIQCLLCYPQPMKLPCVYILASKRNGTLYVGVTSNLVQRIWQHKNDQAEGFTKKYKVHTLVWYEVHETMESAIVREKAIKEWQRAWKLELIEAVNPDWQDLCAQLA